MVKLVEYSSEYETAATEMLCELQKRIVSLDDKNIQRFDDEYRQKYLSYVLQLINLHDGKIYLAINNNKVIGLVAGYIEEKDEEDKLTNRCPKRGVVSELVVNEKQRGNGIGKVLLKRMEQYFVDKQCEYVSINVFSANTNALKFYELCDYEIRNVELLKKLNQED